MQKLTNDKLSIRKDGTLIIVALGTENKGKSLTSGTGLIRSINSKGVNDKTVTISIGESGSGNYMDDGFVSESMNGIGSDAIVNYDLDSNPLIPTKDPVTGNVSDETRPNEIGLGHELIHADRSMKGKSVDYNKVEAFTYRNKHGDIITVNAKTDELETVGLKGKGKYTENKLKKEQGLKEREHTNGKNFIVFIYYYN